MFHSVNYRGTLREVLAKVNKITPSKVHSFHEEPRKHFPGIRVVYYFPDYPSYVWFCEKSGHTPKSTENFFNGIL